VTLDPSAAFLARATADATAEDFITRP